MAQIIRNVWDSIYVDPSMIADAENAKEIISQYSDSQKIPIRILLVGDKRKPDCIVLAGAGALYPWKVGQRVELGMAQGSLWQLKYLKELRVRGIDNKPYQDFVLYDSIKPIRFGKYFADKDAVEYKGIGSYKIYTGLGKHIIYKDEYYNKHRIRRSNMKHLVRSVELPQDEQWPENWEFECSNECYELDVEHKDKWFFDKMDFNDNLTLCRYMRNFLEERGISVTFARNFALNELVCDEKEAKENSSSEDEYSCPW